MTDPIKAKIQELCPDGFYRKGNVQVVCDRYRIKMFDTLEKAVKQLSIPSFFDN